jgi:hypothetical protein
MENPDHREPGQLELTRARRGVDLWSAVEAAQYACAVVEGTPGEPAGRHAKDDFLAAFARLVEGWGGVAQASAATILQDLDPRLGQLERHGLFVHWACVERPVRCDQEEEAVILPLAVIRVGREQSARVNLRLSTEFSLPRPHDGAG